MEQGISRILEEIYSNLPLSAEEGGEFTTFDVERFKTKFESDLSLQVASVVTLVEGLFRTLALLDHDLLQNGTWRFVSYPASLLAKSVLQSLKSQEQTIVRSR